MASFLPLISGQIGPPEAKEPGSVIDSIDVIRQRSTMFATCILIATQRLKGIVVAFIGDPSFAQITMNPIAAAALHVRLSLTTPFRRRQVRQMALRKRAPIAVLFYHRVADTHCNPWTIRRDQFLRHVDYCQANLELIDLGETQRRLEMHDSPALAASFTFDDGYRENCEFALPLLIERRIPCTYFVTTSHITGGIPFPHDAAAGNPLPVNTPSELREWSDAGIEIGCHTHSHIDFSSTDDPDVIRREVIDSKDALEQIIGKPVRYFAFPYGMPAQLTRPAIQAVIQAGYEGFCSAYGAYNLVGKNPLHICRIHGDPEFVRLRNWMTFDHRKVARQPRLATIPQPATIPDSLAAVCASAPTPVAELFGSPAPCDGSSETVVTQANSCC